MMNRNASLAACLYFVTSLAARGQSHQGTGYLFAFPGPGNAGSRFQGFLHNAKSFNPVIEGTGPAGIRQIIAKPDGTKFYALGGEALQSVDPTFTTFRAIDGITGNACVASISPDGKFLLVGAAQTCASSDATARSRT